MINIKNSQNINDSFSNPNFYLVFFLNYLSTKLNIYFLSIEFLSISSKQLEHNKCPFLIQNVLVDLSISLRQIKHLNIGGIFNN